MAMTLITTNPDSTDVDTIEFTSSIDSTYKLYIFKFYDLNPATDNTHLGFQANASGQSGYNETITSTSFECSHSEADHTYSLSYRTANDQAQGTAFQILAESIANHADASCVGALWLFNPSNTTYVKHFYAKTQTYSESSQSWLVHTAGYFNVTAAITNIQFKMSSGNMDAVIKMYGVS